MDLAEKIAIAAADLLGDRPPAFEVKEKSSAIDFATQMDVASETFIVEEILRARPGDGIIGEEGSSRPTTTGLTWVIDPLDGTVNYFYGLPGWNVSIGVKDSQGVLAGAVCAPTINSTWKAARGQGAFWNGKRIHCSQVENMEEALVATGIAYDRGLRVRQAELISRAIPVIRDLRRAGAAAVDLCCVAMGAVDGYFEHSLHEWDWAAGSLIATEAGAIVTSGDGGPIVGDRLDEMIVAAGPNLHPQLLRLLA
jgi:myo-inositol-1(or 4)-monophosphatase